MGLMKTVAKAYKQAKSDAEKQQKAQLKEQSNPSRYYAESVEDGACFPLGVNGLTPVITTYSGGKTHICYTFNEGTSLNALLESLAAVNDLMDEASTLSGHEFGNIETIECRVSTVEQGWAFTRVEYKPETDSGKPNKTPVKAFIESSCELCSPGSYSGFIKYDSDGLINQVEITEWVASNEAYKLKANRLRGKMTIKQVMRLGVEPPIYKA